MMPDSFWSGVAVGALVASFVIVVVASIIDAYNRKKSVPTLPPVPAPVPVLDLTSVDKMTMRKTKELLMSGNSHRTVTGFVLATRDGARTLVELGAVRAFTNEEFWKVMHPTPTHLDALMQEHRGGTSASDVTVEQISVYAAEATREDPTESWYQEKFDFTKIRSVKDTIADLQELVDLTVWQQDTVSRAAVWLSGLAEVNDAWWTEFIRLVDLLTEKPDDDHTRESLIELVSRVVATPVDAH